MTREQLIQTVELTQEYVNRISRSNFFTFLKYSNLEYNYKWFHELIANKCQQVYEGKIKNLMIFVPPQHAKSEIASRVFPAWCLGMNPDLKIIGCTYSADLSQQFSRSIQRNIDKVEYSEIFPNSFLNKKNVRTNAQGGYVRNVDTFEMVGHRGFYKAIGVGGSLTGTPADIGIIDDPVKDAMEAYSQTYRDRVWEWYLNVFLTRLHNGSRQILIQTRWHDDDLSGRILKLEPDKWDVVILPAIKEHNNTPYDIREIGQALWPEKHSLERLLEQKARSERMFAALYQQNPTIDGGNIIKSEWFTTITYSDFNRMRENHPFHFFLDTAYTEKTINDPSGIIATCKLGDKVYITKAKKVRYEFPELIKFIPEWVRSNGYNSNSTIRVEPKANGLSVIQQLKKSTNLNITQTPSPKESKETRANVYAPYVECGNVVLVKDDWNDEFISEVCGFPSRPHDEYLDLLCYTIEYYTKSQSKNLTGYFH